METSTSNVEMKKDLTPFDPNRIRAQEELEESSQNFEDHLRLTTNFTEREILECVNDHRKTNLILPPKNSLGLVKENPLKFPNVMAGAAGEFAKLYSEYLEVPEHFLYMAFFTCLGSVLSDRLTLNSELKPEPRLFTILLGESADDRKSTALIKVVEFFKETLTRETFSVCWGVGSAEGLQARLRDGKKPEDSKRLLLCFDEFKQFINKCKIDTSVLLPCVNSLFELNLYEAHTKTSHVDIDNAYLSLLAASTVQTYERIWKAAFTDIGFNNRLFLVPGSGEKRFSMPMKIEMEQKKPLKTYIIEILKYIGDGLELDITDKARTRYHEWYMSLENSIHTKRLDTYALRLMLLLAVNELRPEIDIEIVEKVITLSNWQLEVRQEFDPIDADTTIAKMEERIRRHLKKEDLTERELRRKLHRVIEQSGVWYFTKAIQNLHKAGDITIEKQGKINLWRLVE